MPRPDLAILPRRGTVAELVTAHAAAGMVAAWLGFTAHELLVRYVPHLAESSSGPATVASTPVETAAIFGNNLVFFTLVAVLPVVNVALFLPQWFGIGTNAATISALAPQDQITLLYRHSIFEVIALLLAIALSYAALFSAAAFLRSATDDRALLVRRFRVIALGYIPIVLLTLAGALLEGTAVVHL